MKNHDSFAVLEVIYPMNYFFFYFYHPYSCAGNYSEVLQIYKIWCCALTNPTYL